MSSTNNGVLSNLLAKYGNSPVLQFLIQSIPVFGSGIDAAAREIILKYQWNKFRVFFEELAKGSISLSKDLIKNDDFLFCFFKTMDAVQRSRKEEKIRFLARLLTAGLNAELFADTDDYEEILSIIDDLSYRELQILALLGQFEKKNPKQNSESDVQWTNRYWSSFVQAISDQLKISADTVSAMLTRLQRSGCYKGIDGSYMDYSGGQGHLTPLYRRLEKIAGTI
jgi:hypothetical protein